MYTVLQAFQWAFMLTVWFYMVFHDPKPCFEANVLHSTHYGADMTFHKACFHVSMFFHDTLFQMQWTIVAFTVFSKHCGNICNTVTVTVATRWQNIMSTRGQVSHCTQAMRNGYSRHKALRNKSRFNCVMWIWVKWRLFTLWTENMKVGTTYELWPSMLIPRSNCQN